MIYTRTGEVMSVKVGDKKQLGGDNIRDIAGRSADKAVDTQRQHFMRW